jgi:hypothetical protein
MKNLNPPQFILLIPRILPKFVLDARISITIISLPDHTQPHPTLSTFSPHSTSPDITADYQTRPNKTQ